jgi:aminoglycoside 6-adenylyltransferase
MTDTHAELIERIVAWAHTNDNIRAVVQTGSSTRAPGNVDRFSDRDLELVCRDPALLAEDDAWLHAIAPVWVALYLDNGDAFDTRLVFFEGGRKVDFTLADRSRIDKMIDAGELNDLYQRGYRVLLDKDRLTAGLPAPIGAAPKVALPSQQEFSDTVTEFWFEAAHMPTYLTRGELWVVKFRDWTMKEMLLRMLEWHALATRGEGTDTWYIGTKMRRWVDEATWAELQHVFARFDRVDSWRGLVASMALFTRLTRETASALGLEYPRESERHITEYVLGFEDERSGRCHGS